MALLTSYSGLAFALSTQDVTVAISGTNRVAVTPKNK